MEYRELGNTGWKVSGIGLGTWAMGSRWGPVDSRESLAALHRAFNRTGQAFDRGETFSGVDFEIGLQAVEELRPLVPPGATMAQMALRWILMFDAVTCTIPGAKRSEQAEDNIRAIYDRYLREQVHHLW